MKNNIKEKSSKLEKKDICQIIRQAIQDDSDDLFMSILLKENTSSYQKLIDGHVLFPLIFENNSLNCLSTILENYDHPKLNHIFVTSLKGKKVMNSLLVFAAKSTTPDLLAILREQKLKDLGPVDFNQNLNHLLPYDTLVEKNPQYVETGITTAITIATFYELYENIAYLVEECGANPNDQVSTLCPLIIQTLLQQGIDKKRDDNKNPINGWHRSTQAP